MKLTRIILSTFLLPSFVFAQSANAGVSFSVLDDDAPNISADFKESQIKLGSRPWRAPQFGSQKNALGFSENVFDVPKGMEKQVQFWTDIYAKYTTQQGVIHDSENIDLIYKEVDFFDIESNPRYSNAAKEIYKERRVKALRKEVVASLLKLSKAKTSKGLNEMELKVWNYFGGAHPKIYKNAASSARVRFQLGLKDRMRSAIYFSGRYLEDMEDIFEQAGLPQELTRLAFVESSFNIMAQSKVGASGIWQIMPYTAKPYKMMSESVDSRNHPLEATKLAAKLLKTNYNMLNSWPLAITGYNHGPTGVKRMTEQYKTRNISDLVNNVRTKVTFGFASRNFYACFLAALNVEKNAPRYFERPMWSKKLDAEEIKLPVAIKYKELLTWFTGDQKRLHVFNPHLTAQARRGLLIPAKTRIAVPKNQYAQVILALGKAQKRGLGLQRKTAQND